MDDELIFFGGSVKALGNGKLGGYLVEFTDFENKSGTPPDVTREFFESDTDFDITDGEVKTVYYHHCLDEKLKNRKLAKGSLKTDEVGIWIETQLALRDEYEKAIYKMAEEGKLGWSSGSAPHLVTKKSVGGATKLLSWPIAEASITPRPCNPYSKAITLKAYVEDLEESIKAEWTTAYVNDLPDSSFAYIESGGEKDDDGKTKPRSLRHFPYKDKDGNPDKAHVRNALARIPQSKVSQAAKNQALRKVRAAATKLGIADKSTKALFEDIFEERTEGLYFLTDIFQSAIWRLQCMDEYWDEARLPEGYRLEEQYDQLFDEFKQRIWDAIFADEDDVEGSGMDAAKSFRDLSGLPDGLKFADHSETVLAAVEGYALKVNALADLVTDWSERAQSIQEIRVKAGRAISAANQEKLRRAHDKIKTVESSLRDVRKGLLNLIPAGTDNKEVTVGGNDVHMKSVDDETLRAGFQRIRTRAIGSQVQ